MDESISNRAVWTRALELFGDEQKVIRWLATPLSELNNRTPEEMLRAAPRGEEVAVILDRVEYGVFN